jgi:hypothetical protein
MRRRNGVVKMRHMKGGVAALAEASEPDDFSRDHQVIPTEI